MFIEPQKYSLNPGHQKKRPNSTGTSGGSNNSASNRYTDWISHTRPNDARPTERDKTSNHKTHANLANDEMNEAARDGNCQTKGNGYTLLQNSTGTIKIAGGDNYNATHNGVMIAGGSNYATSEDNESASGQLCREDLNIIGSNNNDIQIVNEVADENQNAAVGNRNPVSNAGNDVASRPFLVANDGLHRDEGNSNKRVVKNIPKGSINMLLDSGNTIVIKNVIMGRRPSVILVNSSNLNHNNTRSNDNSDHDSDEDEHASDIIDSATAQDDEHRARSVHSEQTICRYPNLFEQS